MVSGDRRLGAIGKSSMWLNPLIAIGHLLLVKAVWSEGEAADT